MEIRFGYVSTALNLWEASPSRTLTYTRWKAMDEQERYDKLLTVTQQNIHSAKRMVHYNIAHEVALYRFSSAMIPLATHPEVRWDYLTPFTDDLIELGTLIKQHNLRVSFHPSAYTLLTSPNDAVTLNAIADLEYHYSLLSAMNVGTDSLLNLHIGGAYGDKTAALARFSVNITKVPNAIRERLTFENDDKTYTTEETLLVCEKELFPLMFDYHHHLANPSEIPLDALMPRILKTWEKRSWKPKIHISSPRSETDFRAHADHVDHPFILPLIKLLKELEVDEIDFMIEAKKKDIAMFALIEDLASLRGAKRIGGGAVRI